MPSTKSSFRLLFVWWWNRAAEIYSFWRDGLRAAIEEIGVKNDVVVALGEEFPDWNVTYDAVLLWGDSNCPFLDKIHYYSGKKGIILTTDPQNFENLTKLDTVFCESSIVYNGVRQVGAHAVQAFGTDTNYFKPDKTILKDKEYFYPATFSPWKRQRDIAYLGSKLWCVGTIQPDGQDDYKACQDNGVNVAIGYYKPEYIQELYQRSKHVIIPAIHGSERTVLEAMACDILPEVTNEQNIRTRSYLEEFKKSGLNSPRKFVEKSYTAKQYADKILKGLT